MPYDSEIMGYGFLSPYILSAVSSKGLPGLIGSSKFKCFL